MRTEVAAERREQVELLSALTEEQWNAPTLCAGWRVREVIAHTTQPYRLTLPRMIAELVKAGGFHRMADRLARRDAAAMSTTDLITTLRDNVDHPWTPPGGGVVGALAHDVIHGLDITVALGLDREPPAERVGLVLAGMTPRNVRYFGADLRGVELKATDLDWRMGEGSVLTGKAQHLLLAVCGRELPEGTLEGEHAARFTR